MSTKKTDGDRMSGIKLFDLVAKFLDEVVKTLEAGWINLSGGGTVGVSFYRAVVAMRFV